ASSATAPQKPDSRTALAQAMPVIQGGRIIGSGSSVASSPRAGPRPRASSPATGTPTAAAHSAVVPPSSAVRRISVRTRADHTRPQVSGGASRSAESAATTGATHSSAIATSAAASPSRAGSERAAGRTMGVPYTARAHPVTEAIPMTARPTVALVLALALPLTASVARAQREPPGGQPAPAGGATGQDGAAARAGGDAADAPPATGAPSELPPIEAPPKISNIDAEKCKRSVKKLRNDNAKYRHAAEQEVIAFGRGAIPFLEEAATTKDEAMMDAIVNALCGVADARDRDRVEAHLTSQLIPLRRFAARKTGDIGLPEMLDRLLPLLGDADRPTQVEAALSLVRNGREEGLA